MRVAAIALLLLTACSGAPSASPIEATDAGTKDAAEPPCGPPPGGAPSEGARCIREVSGSVTDLGGAPVGDLTVTVCGVVCFGALSDRTGAFRVPVRAHLPEAGYAITANGRPFFAGSYMRLPSMAEGAVALPSALVLPRFASETASLPSDGAGGTVQAGPLGLTVASGTSWELELEDLTDDMEGRKLRYAEVPPERAPAFAAKAGVVLALGPFKAKPSKRVGVTVKKRVWPAGTKVDFVVMTDTSTSHTNDAGGAKVVAKGHVAEDGETIRTDDGEGIDRLTWLALVPSP